MSPTSKISHLHSQTVTNFNLKSLSHQHHCNHEYYRKTLCPRLTILFAVIHRAVAAQLFGSGIGPVDPAARLSKKLNLQGNESKMILIIHT